MKDWISLSDGLKRPGLRLVLVADWPGIRGTFVVARRHGLSGDMQELVVLADRPGEVSSSHNYFSGARRVARRACN
jgi:hypothetical protein